MSPGARKNIQGIEVHNAIAEGWSVALSTEVR